MGFSKITNFATLCASSVENFLITRYKKEKEEVLVSQAEEKSLQEDEFIETDFEEEENIAKAPKINNNSSNGNIESLQAQKTNVLSKKTSAQNELELIKSGNSEELTGLKEEADTAYEKYKEAINEDGKNNPEIASLITLQDEIKQQQDTNSIEITKNEAEIAANTAEISEQNSCIRGFESELNSLKSQLGKLSNDDPEAKSKIEKLVSLKEEQLELAKQKLARLENKKTELNETKSRLEGEKQDLTSRETEIQQNIAEKSSELTKQLQEEYNSAKEKYENTKKELTEKYTQEVLDYQAEIEKIDAQIIDAKNQNRENGDYEIKGDDVVALAMQYEGLNNDEMKAIMTSEGARFDDGVWCADFIEFMMEKAYGEENMPDDFKNSCNYCSCSSISEWGSQNGRITTDPSELEAGDAIIMNTTTGGLHIGFVVSVNEDGTINTIEGNTAGDDHEYKNNGEVNKRTRAFEQVNTFIKLNR